jgi:hypothetical protein
VRLAPICNFFKLQAEDKKDGEMCQQWMSLIWPAMRTMRRRIFPFAFIGAYDRGTRTWCTVMTIAIEQPLETFAMYYALSMAFQKITLDI